MINFCGNVATLYLSYSNISTKDIDEKYVRIGWDF